MSRAARITALAAPAIIAACSADPVRQGKMELQRIEVKQTSDTTLRVGVVALNVDGYQLARCVAAAYVNTLVDKKKKKRIWDIYKRTGGAIKDEFRLKGKVRTQRTLGVQTYEFVKEGEHDGRDVMAVDLQLAVCERQGLPTKLGKG